MHGPKKVQVTEGKSVDPCEHCAVTITCHHCGQQGNEEKLDFYPKQNYKPFNFIYLNKSQERYILCGFILKLSGQF